MKATILVRSALGAAIVSTFGVASAQTAPKPDGAWRGSIGAAATVTGGNTSTTNVSVNADAVRQTAIDKLGFYFQDVYGKGRVNGRDQTTAQIVRFGGRYDRDISGNIFAFGGLDVDKNKLSDVRWRLVPAVGLGYHLVKNENNSWDVFAGYAFTKTDYYVAPDRSESSLVLGEESTHKLTPTTAVRQKVVVYPSLKNSGEYRSIAEAGITTQIIGGWSLVANFAHRYDSQAPSGVKKTDTLFFTGLQYGFGPK